MKSKTLQKTFARELRTQGKSLKEISSKLNVAKSSVSLWCRDITLPEKEQYLLNQRGLKAAGRLGALANKRKRAAQIGVIKKLARKEFVPLSPSALTRLKDIGTAIYWAEGTKRGNSVDFTNSDPKMMKIAMLWFRSVCQVPEHRFRASIFYHSGQSEQEIKEFWSDITKIPLTQFHKSMFKKEGTGQRKNVLYYGTCKVRICDCDLLHRILTWIEQLDLS